MKQEDVDAAAKLCKVRLGRGKLFCSAPSCAESRNFGGT